MKKGFQSFCLGAVIFMLMLTGCSHRAAADTVTIYGQITQNDGKNITIAIARQENSEDSENSSRLILTGEEQIIEVSEKTEIKKEKQTSDGKTKVVSAEYSIKELSRGSTVKVVLNGAAAQSVTLLTQDAVAKAEEADTASAETADTSAKGSIELTGVLQADGKSEQSDKESVKSSKANENVVLVRNGGTLTMKNASLTKSGDTSSVDESNFYGVNAVFLVTEGSEANISDSQIASSSIGANGLFAAGNQALLHVSSLKIGTSGDASRGIAATYGGTIDATDVDITTSGTHSTPVSSGKNGGSVTVKGGTVSASGEGSPCIYSAGKVEASDITGESEKGMLLVVEGEGFATLKKSNLAGGGEYGVLLYQSASGDAADGTAEFKAEDSSLTVTSEAPLFYVTNTKAETVLDNTTLTMKSNILARIEGNHTNSWGKEGENGGHFTLSGIHQILNGNILCDEISTVSVKLTEYSILTGTVNGDNKGADVDISLDKTSQWELTGDSYVNSIKNEESGYSNILSNGHTIYYDSSNKDNSWLNGKTIELRGGGKLTPSGK